MPVEDEMRPDRRMQSGTLFCRASQAATDAESSAKITRSLAICLVTIFYVAFTFFEGTHAAETDTENARYWTSDGELAIGSFQPSFRGGADTDWKHVYFPLFRSNLETGDKLYVHLGPNKVVESELYRIEARRAPCSDDDIYFTGVLKLEKSLEETDNPNQSIYVIVSDIEPHPTYKAPLLGELKNFGLNPALKSRIDQEESLYFMDSIRKQLDTKDAVAIRENYFPFKEIDQKISDESETILTKRSSLKAYRMSSTWEVILVNSEWSYESRVVALMSSEHMIKNGAYRHSVKTRDFIGWMRMPEFSRRTWSLEQLKFYEGVFDVDFDSTAEVLVSSWGYESCGWELRRFMGGSLKAKIIEYFHGL